MPSKDTGIEQTLTAISSSPACTSPTIQCFPTRFDAQDGRRTGQSNIKYCGLSRPVIILLHRSMRARRFGAARNVRERAGSIPAFLHN